MKLCFLIASFIISSSLLTSAQTLIPRFGLTFSKSTLSSDDTPNHYSTIDFRRGFLAGIGIDVPISNRISFQPEILYIEKGEVSQHLHKSTTGKFYDGRNFFLRYIELPILIKIGIARKIPVYLTSGVSVSYGIGGEVTYDVYYDNGVGNPDAYIFTEKITYSNTQSYSYMDNRIDMGVQIGAGVLLLKRVNVDVRYSMGFSDIEYFHEAYGRNRVLQLSVAVPITLKKKAISDITQ